MDVVDSLHHSIHHDAAEYECVDFGISETKRKT